MALKHHTYAWKRWISALLPIPEDHFQGGLFRAFGLLTLICIAVAIGTEMWWLGLAPFIILIAWLVSTDLKATYFLMLAVIPLSIEAELPGGFSTDLGSEQLMWLLTLTGTLWFVRNWHLVDARFLKHPVTLALFAHLAWIAVSAVSSQDVFISIKFLIAKGWYVIVFYFMAGRFLVTETDLIKFVWWFFVPLVLAVLSVLIRHAAIDFSFQDVAYVMGPFFRNHVMYACLLAIFIPFLWFSTYQYPRGSRKWMALVSGIGILLLGINFAYTRAAYVALVAAIGLYWVIRWRLMKIALVVGILFMGIFVNFVQDKDNWLLFAPDYERAITHTRFENLLEATTKLEDISTMERVYRWVAATYMIKERPLTGFGPSNFYFYYRKYTVSSFKTYVSHNPEGSGIHNYYLMTAVEQGLPGMAIFILFCFTVMLMGERIFHQTMHIGLRRMLMAALLCFILIALMMLMNDFVETDKIGSLFFISAAILVNIDLYNKDQIRE